MPRRRRRRPAWPLTIWACRQARIRSEIPLDVERVETLLGRPEVIAHHGNGIVEPQDVAAPPRAYALRVGDLRELAAEHGAHRDGRDLHARDLDIDAVDGLAAHLVRRVEALLRRADQCPGLGILERHLLSAAARSRQAARATHRCGAPRRAMRHRPPCHAATGGVDVPLLRRRLRPARRARWRRPCADRSSRRVSMSSRPSPAARAADWHRACRSAARSPASTWSSPTSSSSASSIDGPGPDALAHLGHRA